MCTIKNLNIRTPNNFVANSLKPKTKRIYHEILHPKDVDGKADSQDLIRLLLEKQSEMFVQMSVQKLRIIYMVLLFCCYLTSQ